VQKLLSHVLLRPMIRGAEGMCLSAISLHSAELPPVTLRECWMSFSLRGTTVIQHAASNVIRVIRKVPCYTKVPQRHTALFAAPGTAAAPQVHCNSVGPPDLQQPRPESKSHPQQCSYTALSQLSAQQAALLQLLPRPELGAHACTVVGFVRRQPSQPMQ
jgi:hypothetical protein